MAHFGYRIRARWYANLEEFSNVEHYLFARFTHFFPTRTSLIVETNYGRKNYLQGVATDASPSPEAEHYGWHDGGRGHMGTPWWGAEASAGGSRYGVGQAVGLLRLAQSLDNSTGLSLQVLLRRNPANNVRYLAGQVSGYTTEDELFDDRYGYESHELSGTLTRLLPWRMTLVMGSEAQWKDYVNRPALDLSGQPLATGELRHDRRFAAWVTLARTLSTGNRELSLLVELYWLDNRSNDRYYDYSTATFSVGVSTEF